MNQNRVSRFYAISAAICLFSSGVMFVELVKEVQSSYFFYFAAALLVGIGGVASLTREANAWQFNVTPHNLKLAPQGSWAVICVGTYRHNPQDDAVYVAIAKTPACDRSLSTLRLPSEWINIRDYQAIVKGRQPLGVSIGDRITFTWE